MKGSDYMENIFKKYDTVQKSDKFKKLLIEKRGNKCECCGNDTWLTKPIPLELHHIDRDHSNLKEDNLQLLCPNCHNLTDGHHKNKIKKKIVSEEELIEAIKNNYSIRQALLSVGLNDGSTNYRRAYSIMRKNNIQLLQKTEKKKENFCIDCGKPITLDAIRCIECNGKYKRIINIRPSREELKQLIRTKPFTQIGKQFNISDNAIRKWCDAYNLPRKSSEIKKYSDEEWENI